MLGEIKTWISKLFGTNKIKVPVRDPELNFVQSSASHEKTILHPDADVHKLMIKATRIRKTEGYPAAISYLKDLIEAYIRDCNTALVVSMNKLIPYMKRDENLSSEEIKDYLSGIIERLPETEPYFLNLHITMANLIRSGKSNDALPYMQDVVKKEGLNIHTFNLHIRLAELYIEDGELDIARDLLDQLKALLHPGLERYQLIKMERKWHRCMTLLHFAQGGETGCSKFLYHRFVEFALDMARVLDPMHIDNFHKRKDLYYKLERGFANTDNFMSALDCLKLTGKQEALIQDVYGFSFEEMPGMLGVSEKVLNYHPGDSESLEELREKKVFFRKPFDQLHSIEVRVNSILKKYTG